MAVSVLSGKLHAALSKSIPQRCIDLERLLEETSIKDLHSIFAPIVEHIFGFNNQAGWNMLQICKSRYDPTVYSSVYRFLSPDGPLFKLIYKLQCDEYMRYEFSLTCLPYPTRCKLDEGHIPTMYRNKYLGPSQNALWLYSFDFYFYHFAFYITNMSACKTSPVDPPSENLYFSLLECYLDTFLPLRGKDVPPMPHEAPPVRGPINHHHHPHHQHLLHIRSPLRSPLRSGGPYSHVQPHSPSQQVFTLSPSGTHVAMTSLPSSPVGGATLHHHSDQNRQQETWRTESLIQIFVEFWLNQSTIHDASQLVPSSPLAGDRIGLFTAMIRDHYLASVDHVRCVRMLVKQIHYFSNSLQPNMYNTVTSTSLDEIKRSVWPTFVQKRLYVFLKHGFQKWPLDASFRMMLETWLSYIQPWRYLDPNQSEREDIRPSSQSDHEDEGSETLRRWSQFIQENLLFYSELFQDFSLRISRTDLSSPKNAYMLYRVAKLYGVQELIALLRAAEQRLQETMPRPQNQTYPDLGASYISPNSQMNTSYSDMSSGGYSSVHVQRSNSTRLLTLPSLEIENYGFTYRLLFSDKARMQVEQLLHAVNHARQSLVSRNGTNSGSSLLSWLGLSSVEDYNNVGRHQDYSPDGSKTSTHLTHAATLLRRLYDIDEDQVSPINLSTQSDRSANDSLCSSSKLLPDHVLTNLGPRLTPLGRFQVMNGCLRLPVTYTGDPELRPISSFENKFLVRLFYQVATFFNQKFGDRLSTMYEGSTLKSRMVQHVVLPPYTSPPPSSNAHSPRYPQTPLQRQLANQPRISLRFLADYQTLGYLSCLYLFIYMWLGLGPVPFFFLLACFVFIWVAILALFIKKKTE